MVPSRRALSLSCKTLASMVPPRSSASRRPSTTLLRSLKGEAATRNRSISMGEVGHEGFLGAGPFLMPTTLAFFFSAAGSGAFAV